MLAAGALSLSGALAGPAPAGAATSPCTVAYTVVNSWPGGFQAGHHDHQQRARRSAAGRWPSTSRTRSRSAAAGPRSYTQNGQTVTVASQSYNGALATGASTTMGFTGTVGAADAVPGYFTVNGYACNGAAQLPR